MKPIMYSLVAIVVLAFLMALVGALRRTAVLRYRARPLMTANELEFLGRLEKAAPELRFHAQVSMAALVDPDVGRRENGAEHMRLRGKVAQKRIDFVAQDRTNGAVVALIELDDRTHNIAKDAERDALTAAAGFRTIRWASKKKPEPAEIRTQLLG